jgi:hypothetical protein
MNEYYEEILRDEYLTYSSLKFTESEKLYIENKIKIPYNINIGITFTPYLMINSIISYNDGSIHRIYWIKKCPDEWFLVEKKIESRTSKYKDIKNVNYYKCDQWDGLLKFLEDESVI